MRLTRSFALFVITMGLSGCLTGSFNFSPPSPVSSRPTPVVVNRARAEVWKDLVPRLAQTFFVINNIDQSSGLINISYSGDPEKFVDCGHLTSTVKNARGQRTYDVPVARAHQVYERTVNAGLYGVDRAMSLEGRANLVLEEPQPNVTRVSVNVRYVLAMHERVTDVLGKTQDLNDNLSFNSGERATFQGSMSEFSCQPNSTMEQQLLALLPR